MKINQEDYPEKYWHCQLKIKGESRGWLGARVVNDWDFDEVQKQIILPLKTGRSFIFDGAVINNMEQVEEIRIVYTQHPKSYYIEQYEAKIRRQNDPANFGALADRNLLPIHEGRDYSNELLFSSKILFQLETDITLIVKICERIPYSARILAQRSRIDKKPYTVEDEYDVQDLLHAVIRAYTPYSVQEDPLNKVAGSRAGRVDISIEDLGVLVEVKYAREPKDQAKFVDDFHRDLGLYAKWPPLQYLIYIVYNAVKLRDPEALKRLEGEKEIYGQRFYTYIVLAG